MAVPHLPPDRGRHSVVFDDLLAANERYQTEFHDSGVQGRAAKGLACLLYTSRCV